LSTFAGRADHRTSAARIGGGGQSTGSISKSRWTSRTLRFTRKEIRTLLNARGGFVRLGTKGWKRLRFQLSTEDEEQLADLGLDARDLSDSKQRLHALQLAGKSAATRLLPADQASAIERRVEMIRTRVAPDFARRNPGIDAAVIRSPGSTSSHT
jgi:hypothetical protein